MFTQIVDRTHANYDPIALNEMERSCFDQPEDLSLCHIRQDPGHFWRCHLGHSFAFGAKGFKSVFGIVYCDPFVELDYYLGLAVCFHDAIIDPIGRESLKYSLKFSLVFLN